MKKLSSETQVGRVIEESEQEWPAEGRRAYHALSRCFGALSGFLRKNKSNQEGGLQTRCSDVFTPKEAQ